MARKEIFNDWTIFSEDFNFDLFSNGNEVIIKDGTNERNQLFEGKIETNTISIYDLSSYSCNLEIEYYSKAIEIIKIEYEEEN